MSFAGIQATIDFYTMRESELTNLLSDIIIDVTRATKDSFDVAEELNNKKNALSEYYDPKSSAYDEAKDALEEEYEVKLSEISEWESELKLQQSSYETEIKETSSYKESLISVEKNNIQKDFKYGNAS